MNADGILRLPINEMTDHPELTPLHDPHFRQLIAQAAGGTVPVYFAAVPLRLCIPFDVEYRPDQHPVGRLAIDQVKAEWQAGSHQHLYVYQRGEWFVVSDDYIPLFAALEGNAEFVPCWVFGHPDSAFVQQVQGPLTLDDVRSILGLV